MTDDLVPDASRSTGKAAGSNNKGTDARGTAYRCSPLSLTLLSFATAADTEAHTAVGADDD